MKIVRCNEGPMKPWKNGGGRLRDVAVWPEGAGLHDFSWRLSMAEMTEDGPFSEFPGIDRHILLVSGAGMEMDFGGGARPLVLTRRFLPLSFPGELAPQVRLLDGPVLDFNVMTRRGEFAAAVTPVRPGRTVPEGTVAVIACGAGRTLLGEVELDQGDALVGPLEGLPLATSALAIQMRAVRG